MKVKSAFRLFIFGFLFLKATSLCAQNNEIDALKRRLNAKLTDTTKCYVLNKLVELTGDDQWPAFNQELKNYCELKLKATSKTSKFHKTYKKYLAESINNVGYLFMYQGDLKNALKNYQASLLLHQEIGNYNGIAVSLNNIGAVFENQGDIIQALNYYDRSLKIKEKLKNDQGIANSLNNIGLIYSNLGDYSNALRSFKRSLKIEQKLKNDNGIGTSFHNIGLIYSKLGNNQEAEINYYLALAIFKKTHDDQGKAYCLYNLGEISQNKKKYQQAMVFYNQSLFLRRKIQEKKGVAISLHALSQIYFILNDTINSKKYAIESLKLAQELGYPEVIKNAANQLYQINKKNTNFSEALSMLELYRKMNDSIYNIETQKASSRHQLNYEFKRKEERYKAAQEKKDLIYKNRAKQQTLINWFSIGVISVIVFFSSILYKRFKISQKQREIIFQKEIETQRQKKILELKNKEITDSIRYAKRIQSAILPAEKYIKNILPNHFVLYQPKDIVAGDFYWFEKVANLTFFAVADCTGHGVPGAMVSVVCHNALNRCIREFHLTDPGEILNTARSIINEEFEKSDENVNDGMDISLGILNQSENILSWAGANNPIWILRKNEIIEFKPDKQPVGKYYSEKPFTSHEIKVKFGDVIYLLTDGFQDQFGGEFGKKFKAKQIKEIILEIQGTDLTQQAQIFTEILEKWKGELEQVDDICLIGIKI